MSWCRQLFGLYTLVGAGLLAGGCAKDSTTLPQSRDTPMILNLPDQESHTVRSQQPEVPLKPPPMTPLPAAPPPSTAAAQTPTGLPAGFDTRFAVQVRAWVNNKAIFDDEVRMRLPREALMEAFRLPPEKRDEAMQKVFQQTLDNLIDLELLKQDALHKLEKNPTYLQKIQTEAAKEAEKRIKELIKATGAHSPEEFKKGLQERGTTEESLRGQFVREFIAGEYLKVIIFPKLRRIGHQEIEDYYQEHLNEFQTIDRVKWQDIFILVGEKHPTMAHARQFAQYVVEQWKQGADISQLMKYDEGEGRFHEGAGIGQIKGEIKPSELERWLFGMKDGEIGPLFELGTGVHVFRLVKREYAGVMEFDEKTQQMIGNKLKSEMYERERKCLIHDLREKATYEIVRPGGN
jgi:hypothetical protein